MTAHCSLTLNGPNHCFIASCRAKCLFEQEQNKTTVGFILKKKKVYLTAVVSTQKLRITLTGFDLTAVSLKRDKKSLKMEKALAVQSDWEISCEAVAVYR